MNWSIVVEGELLYEELNKEQKFWSGKDRRHIVSFHNSSYLKETEILKMELYFPENLGQFN